MSSPTPDHSLAIREAIFAGNKILAIKLHREQTGLGLKESKEAVEKLETELRASSAGQFQAPKAKGCFATIAFLAMVGAALGWLVERIT